jgi:hypothetical protein
MAAVVVKSVQGVVAEVRDMVSKEP